MFDQLFKRTAAIGRHTKAPLYAERVRYLAHLASLGSTRQTLRDKAWDLLHIQAAMQLRSPTAVTMSRIEKAVDRWVKQRRCRRPGALYECKRQALISLGVRWLKFLGWLECDVRKDPNAAKIEAFQSYMRDERCLSPVTIHTQLCRATEFLGLISFFGRRLGSVDIETIDNILRLKSSRDGLTRVSIQRYVSDVRNFLRYAEMQNWCRKGLADALPPCRTYKNEALPASPSLESVNRLIAQTDAQRPCDLRNRAILLLLALYGLRSSEVRRICLEDVDWDHRVLLIRRTKPSQEVQAYPLVPSVAESIADYLKRGRPQTKQRVIFLHARAPYLPLSNAALWDIVSQRLRSLNEPIRHYGPHALRHACASRLLASGFSIEEIGEFLGHHSLDSTRVYAKVDVAALRRVAELDLRGAP